MLNKLDTAVKLMDEEYAKNEDQIDILKTRNKELDVETDRVKDIRKNIAKLAGQEGE